METTSLVFVKHNLPKMPSEHENKTLASTERCKGYKYIYIDAVTQKLKA